MTEITIDINHAKKSLKVIGLPAAGEHAKVTVRGITASPTLRLRVMDDWHLLTVFPMPQSADTWEQSEEDAVCELNLNTVQLLRRFPPANPRYECQFIAVLDDPGTVESESFVLYGTGPMVIRNWPKTGAEETPIDLDEYPARIDRIETKIDTHIANASVHVTAEEKTAWNAKQNALVFDDVPTAGSANPVKSGGIYNATVNFVLTHTIPSETMRTVFAGLQSIDIEEDTERVFRTKVNALISALKSL